MEINMNTYISFPPESVKYMLIFNRQSQQLKITGNNSKKKKGDEEVGAEIIMRRCTTNFFPPKPYSVKDVHYKSDTRTDVSQT